MAELPFLDSAQHYDFGTRNMKWTASASDTILPSGGRDGNAAHQSGDRMKTFLNEYPTLTLGNAFMWPSFPSATLFQIRNFRFNNPNIADVVIMADGRMSISSCFGSSSHIVAGFVANINTWYFVEVQFAVSVISSNVALTCEVHIDNAVIESGIVLSGAGFSLGADGIPSGGAKIASIIINRFQGTAMLDCDTYVTETEFFSDTSCRAYFPRADGTYTAGVPSTPGPHFNMVKEHVPDSGATTVELAAVNDRDSYFMDTVSGFSDVLAVQFLWCVAKSAAGVSSFEGTLTSGASDQLTDEFFPAFSIYLYFIASFRKSPHTAADWTVSELNGQEVGMKRIT